MYLSDCGVWRAKRASGTRARVFQKAPDSNQTFDRLTQLARQGASAMDIQKDIEFLLDRIPYRYAHKRLPIVVALSDADLDAFSERTGFELPEEIRAWFKIANGLFAGEIPLYGIRPRHGPVDLESELEYYPFWKRKRWLPISDDRFGNHYIVPLGGDFGPGFPVIFVETIVDETKPGFIVASDLEHFIRGMIKFEVAFEEAFPVQPMETDWPFEEEEVLREDPAILNFTGIALPWET